MPRLIENNVFVLRGAPDETTNEVGAAADLSTRFLSVHLEQSYRHFNDDGLVSLPSPGLPGLRTDTSLCDDASRYVPGGARSDGRNLGDPPAAPGDPDCHSGKWSRGTSLPTRPVRHSSATTEGGVGRAGTSGPNEDFTAVLAGRGDTHSDVHVVEVGTSYAFLPSLIGHLDYRFHLVDEDGDGLLEHPAGRFSHGTHPACVTPAARSSRRAPTP